VPRSGVPTHPPACDPYPSMRNPGSRELRRRQARLESQRRAEVRDKVQAQAPSQQERLKRGGLFLGMSSAQVTRLSVAVTVAAVVLVALGALALVIEVGQHDLPLGVVLLVLAVVCGGAGASVIAPAVPPARRDRKAQVENVQGQLVGASEVSGTPTLALVALNVNRGIQEFRVRPELYAKLQGGAVTVGLTVTPNLQHVTTLTVIRRDRLAKLQSPPISRAMRMSVWLPYLSFATLIGGLAIGGAIGALLPLGTSPLHAFAAALLAAALAGAVALGLRLYAKRLVQGLDLPA